MFVFSFIIIYNTRHVIAITYRCVFIYKIVELEEVQGQSTKKTQHTKHLHTDIQNVARNTSVNLSRTSQYAQKLVTVQYEILSRKVYNKVGTYTQNS